MNTPHTLDAWLVVSPRRQYSSNGGSLSGRLSVNRPRLERNEVAIKVHVEVPRSAFARPALEVAITVPETAVLQPVLEVLEPEQEQPLLDDEGAGE